MNTMQFEFDAVVAHLYKQGRPASSASVEGMPNGCYYRQPGTGLMCAVGCRIPDSIYDLRMDKEEDASGTGISRLIDRFGSILPPEIPAYQAMFQRLQTAHDTHYNGKFNFVMLERDLSSIAKEFGLIFTAPTEGE